MIQVEIPRVHFRSKSEKHCKVSEAIGLFCKTILWIPADKNCIFNIIMAG